MPPIADAGSPHVGPCPAFRPRFPWIGGDLQTVRNYLVPGVADLSQWPAERGTFAPSDGSDDRLLGALHRPGAANRNPLVVLVHGLTGCEASFYVLETARYLLANGYPVLRANLRGAGPSRSTCGGHYCAGSGADIGDILSALAPEDTRNGVVLVGYSLGGSVVLNYLSGVSGPGPAVCAVTVSAPLDLAAAADRMMRPRNVLYHRWLLARMKAEATGGAARVSGDERAAIASARSVYEFDDRFVAPRNGYAGADDYYDRCSAAEFLDTIRVPVLLLHGRDDPWIPSAVYDRVARAQPGNVTVQLTDGGGHVGFHGVGDRTPWHNRCLQAFISAQAAGRGAA